MSAVDRHLAAFRAWANAGRDPHAEWTLPRDVARELLGRVDTLKAERDEARLIVGAELDVANQEHEVAVAAEARAAAYEQTLREAVWAVVGHYCPTDANPLEDIRGTLGVLDHWIGCQLFDEKQKAEAALADGHWPDGRLVLVAR